MDKNIIYKLNYFQLPTKRQLFQEFVLQQRWKKYCDKNVNEVLESTGRGTNITSVHDVPFSIRMEEIVDKRL